MMQSALSIPSLLNGINRRVDVTTAAVVIGGMDVDAQWLSADLLSVDPAG